LSALNKLKDKLQVINPEGVLSLTDAQLRACYFSRQKTVYIKNLATSILNGETDLERFKFMEDEDIRLKLTSLKGIGNWTVDVYLMFVLHRADVFPLGDLAAIHALKALKSLPITTSKEEIGRIASQWKPFRTAATMMLWHYYLSKKNILQKHR
jgi:DNA-3-methyladenine glycosylase II